MEHLIKTFTCVIRNINNADDILRNVTALLNGSIDVATISDHDRLGVLDFPDTATQEANVAASTSLSKAELLEQATSSPSALNDKEIDLLNQRYWLDLTTARLTGRWAAKRGLLSLSQEHRQQATDQLKKVRAMLYSPKEEDALSNAEMENWRRMMDASEQRKQRQKQEFESRLGTAQPWVKRLWQENKGEKNWGYAVFRDPKAVNEEYEVRKDAVLMNAKNAVGCGQMIGARWRPQYLDWPSDCPILSESPHNRTASERPLNASYVEILPVQNNKVLFDQFRSQSKELAEDVEKHAQVKTALEANDTRDEDITSELEERFQVLRQHFRNVRDRAPRRQKTASNMQTDLGALEDGILGNVFLVIDERCVSSLCSLTGNVDDMWVYAVDPDYSSPIGTSAVGISSKEYRNYLRVRLQQLVNNFFDARRFHADEFPMQTLWRAAQPSRNSAFVSVKESEQQLWTFDRFVGSALRPEGVARPMVKLLY